MAQTRSKPVTERFTSDIDQLKTRRMAYGLLPLVSYLAEQGIEAGPSLVNAGLGADAIVDPNALMDLKQELTFIESALSKTSDPGLGLKIGPRYDLSSYGMLGLAMMSSATLYEGLQTSTDFISLNWSRLRWQLQTFENVAVLRAQEVEPLGDSLKFMLERDFSAIHTACGEMLGCALPLQAARFSFSEPEHSSAFDTQFNCPVEFNSKYNELAFDSSWLAKPLPRANEAIRKMSYAESKDILTKLMGANTFAQLIKGLVIGDKGNFRTLVEISNLVHMSPRTIRRKLSQEGINFQVLIRQLREKIAKSLLLDSDLNVDQIAEKLGYSDTASFCNAFKRWTNRTPGSYRLSAKQ